MPTVKKYNEVENHCVEPGLLTLTKFSTNSSRNSVVKECLFLVPFYVKKAKQFHKEMNKSEPYLFF